MYEGYLIEIDGEKIPQNYIDVSTYQPIEKRNILLEFKDGTDTTHRVYAKRKEVVLTFETQELAAKDYKQFSALLNKKSVEIKFYNPKTDEYQTELFFCPKEIEEQIYIRKNGEVYVKPVKIEMEGA